MNVVTTLRSLFAEVQRLNPEPMPQPGLPRPEISRLLGSVGLPAPEPLVALYEWHNGILHLNAFLHYLPLEEAIALHHACRKASRNSPRLGWKPTWLPILDVNGDVQLCIDLSGGSLHSIDLIDEKSELVADHFISYVNGVAELFNLKAFHYDPESGAIVPDDAAWHEISRKHRFSPKWA